MHITLKPGDKALIIIIAIAFVAGAAWWLLTSLGACGAGGAGSTNGADTTYLVVTQTKDGFRRVDELSADTEFSVKTPGTGSGEDADGGINAISIESGVVSVPSSNCSNQVCVEHDQISQPGEQIVCLPHGLVIEVVEHEEDATALQ